MPQRVSDDGGTKMEKERARETFGLIARIAHSRKSRSCVIAGIFSGRPTIRDKSPRAIRLTRRRGDYPTARKLIYFGDCAMHKLRGRRVLASFLDCLSFFFGILSVQQTYRWLVHVRLVRKCNRLIFLSWCVLKNWLRLTVRAITEKFTFYDSFVMKRHFCNLLSNLYSCIFVCFWSQCFSFVYEVSLLSLTVDLVFFFFSNLKSWLTYHDDALFFVWTYNVEYLNPHTYIFTFIECV